MAPVGFEPTISAGERPKTYALDRAATGTGNQQHYVMEIRRYVTAVLEQGSTVSCPLKIEIV